MSDEEDGPPIVWENQEELSEVQSFAEPPAVTVNDLDSKKQLFPDENGNIGFMPE